jgi:uncharacterized repeat protein (TIGR03803 family)
VKRTAQDQNWVRPRYQRAVNAALACMLLLVPAAIAVPAARAQTYSLLYSFQCGTDGSHPYGGLVRDSAGNLYGTTFYGGTLGKGTVFELTAAGTEAVLYDFTNGADGGYPNAGLVRDAEGDLYGTTAGGGLSSQGVVFRVAPGGAETVLYDFTGGLDGGYPNGGLIRDASGNLYGTTFSSGANGFGTVFKLAPSGLETVLYNFAGGLTDGANPQAGLARDAAGNLYGTTLNGGALSHGMVFKCTLRGTETVLHSFAGASTDGSGPAAGLLRDSAGNLYGTTNAGGSGGNGIVFKLDAAGSETPLYNFEGGADGRDPSAVLDQDSQGNFYGATQFGGSGPCEFSACGVIFGLSPVGAESVLHSFSGFPTDGAIPYGGLIPDGSGNLYGTTSQGGVSNCGTVFELTP